MAVGILGMLMAASCQRDASNDALAEGGVRFSASISNTLATRADNAELLNNANVKIYKPSFAGLVREYTFADMPDVVYLPEGEGYRVDVVAGEAAQDSPVIASFDSKSYKGSADFSVVANQVSSSPVVVEANISNAITNITFGESIAEAFGENYSLTIGLDGNNLEYNSANSGADGYFIVADDAIDPMLEWSFNGTMTKDSQTKSKSGSFKVEQGKKYTMNLIYIEKNGDLSVEILVDKSTDNYNDQIIFEPSSTGLTASRAYEVWATHATVHADVDLGTYDATKVYFQYRAVGTEDWSRSAAATQASADGAFDGVISGLNPDTEYEYQLVVTATATGAEEVIEGIKSFTTTSAPTLPNSSFEDYDESGSFHKFYNSTAKWWDCGNQTVAIATVDVTSSSTDIPNPSTIEGSYDVGTNTRSVRMKSKEVYSVFAAGNLYSGEYGGTDMGTMSGSVKFGRPFTGRPTAIRLYTKYTTGTIDKIGNTKPDGVTKDETLDRAQVKVVLGDWDSGTYGGDTTSPVYVSTEYPNEIIDFAVDGAARKAGDKTKGTIAYGTAIIDGAGPVTINGQTDAKTYADYNSWNVLTIPIVYYDTKTTPTHIIVSFTASAWGDYMTGSTSSDLYVDVVELIYDSNVVE